MNILDQIKIKKDRDVMIHILRNPYGWSDDVIREIRTKAAQELERLWVLEKVAMSAAQALTDASGGSA